MARSAVSDTPKGRIAVRWFFFLTFFHLLPSPWYIGAAGGLAPAAFLFAAGFAGLFNTDSSSLPMAVMLLVPALVSGLVFALLAYLLAATIYRLKQPAKRSLSLVAIFTICVAFSVNPIYVSGSHGGGDAFSLFDFIKVLNQFRVVPETSISYFVGLFILLVLLLLYQHSPQMFPVFLSGKRISRKVTLRMLFTGGVLFVVVFCWVHRVNFFVRPLAGMGVASAQYRLAMAIETNPSGEFRTEVPYRVWLERAAEQGHGEAAMALTRSPLSAEEKRRWLNIAAEGGVAEAQYQLYQLISRNASETSERETALKWLRASAKGGANDACYELGGMLVRGNGVLSIEKDAEKGREWWEKCAAAGHGKAMRELAVRYENGADLFPRDPEKAIYYYKKMAEGYGQGLYGLKQNDQFAESILKKASNIQLLDEQIKGGQPDALARLGWQLLDASNGSEETKSEGLILLEKAVESGNGKIEYDLGAIYMFGNKGVKKDFVKGRKWWDRAAENNHVQAMEYLVPALQTGNYGYSVDLLKSKDMAGKLVEAYSYGRYGAHANEKKARYWLGELDHFERLFDLAGGEYYPLEDLRRRANKKNPAAQYQLGRQMLVAGSSKERREGLHWIEQAAENGLAEAQYRLVTYYESKLHILHNDPKRGITFLEAAAKQNHLPAMATLAIGYHKGRHSLTKNYRKAVDWYEKLLQVYASGDYEGQIDDRFIDFQKAQLNYATKALKVQEEKDLKYRNSTPHERKIIEIKEKYRKQYEVAVNSLDRRDGSDLGKIKFRAKVERLRLKYVDLREKEVGKVSNSAGIPPQADLKK